MNKEEILAKSRKEGRDEGKEYVDSCGRRYGTAAMCIMFTVLAVFNLYQGQSCFLRIWEWNRLGCIWQERRKCILF